MRIAIACPGPSLMAAAEQIRTGYDLVIGVNRAPLILLRASRAEPAVRVDAWCFDARAFIAVQREPIGLDYAPRVFTSRSGETDIAAARLWKTYRAHEPRGTWDDLMGRHPPAESEWTNYSATAAVILAIELGAKVVHGFGMDWEPEAADADGVRLAGDRSAGRFASERVVWGKTARYALGRGVGVARCWAR